MSVWHTSSCDVERPTVATESYGASFMGRCIIIVLSLFGLSAIGCSMDQAAPLPLASKAAAAETTPRIAVRADNEEFLRQYAATLRFSLGRPRSATVTPDGKAVLFLRSPPRSF